MKRYFVFFLIGSLLLIACTREVHCARFLIPANFEGRMTIYFDKKNGQKEFDKAGCIVYRISENGYCYSALPMEEGFAYPHKTFRFFAVYKKDSMIEIPEFDKNEYVSDLNKNEERKYVFYNSSGYVNPTGSDPNSILVYYVDFGKNYMRY